MKRLILASIVCLFAMVAYSQPKHHRVHFKSVYTTVDTLVLKNVPTVNPNKDGSCLVALPREQNLVVAYDNERTKAIVLHGYPWAKRMEYTVKYEGYRLILYYKDKHVYCGYIYDERAKACQYFEAINESEKDRIVNRFPFLKRMPTFTDTEKE